jgi:hypothetical protein
VTRTVTIFASEANSTKADRGGGQVLSESFDGKGGDCSVIFECRSVVEDVPVGGRVGDVTFEDGETGNNDFIVEV